jgi:1-acyl-sn-glycerol-3-phosphate acyltransferase
MYKPYSWVPRALQSIAWPFVRLLLLLFCRFEVRGKKNLKHISQAIFAVNHANELDPIMVAAAVTPLSRFSPLFYVVAPYGEFRDSRFGWRRFIYTGYFFEAWGAFATRRGLKNYAKALEVHLAILQDGGSVCVFPEGGITVDGALREPHGGVAYLCFASGIPIVPVSISGTYRLSVRNFLTRSHCVSLTFGKPLYAKDILQNLTSPEVADYKQGAHVVMENIGYGLTPSA